MKIQLGKFILEATFKDTTCCLDGNTAMPGHGEQCCCNCRSLKIDHSHPLTDGKPCSNIRGFICTADGGQAYSGWTQHGLCELWVSNGSSLLQFKSVRDS